MKLIRFPSKTLLKRLCLVVVPGFFLSTFFINCGQSFTTSVNSESLNPDNAVSELASCGPTDRLFPTIHYALPIAQRAQLQSALDTHKIVVLGDGDYSVGVGAITLKSNQQLYGIPGRTIVPQINVEPGTSNALLKGVRIPNGGLIFPTSSLSTHNNCFALLVSSVKVVKAVVEKNIFLSLYLSQIDLDGTGGGAIRNNRFIRTMSHGAGAADGKPGINLIGRSDMSSYGNTFVFVNQLGPIGSPIVVQNQDDVSFVGVDVEDYDAPTDMKAMMYVRNVRSLMTLGLQGAVIQGMLDIGAEDFFLFGQIFYGSGNPPFLLRSENKRTAWFMQTDALWSKLTDENPSGLRIHTDLAGQTDLLTVGNSRPSNLSGAQALSAQDFLVNDKVNANPWPVAEVRPIPDPAGPQWNQNLAAQPSDTPMIQALINAKPSGVIQLEARKYYLDAPIKLTNNQVLMGQGPDKTVLIAKNDSVNMIEPNIAGAGGSESATVALGLMNLTVQGGNIGLNFNQAGVQLSSFYFSHVTFRNFKTAGIFLENTYAWDNGYLEYVNFYKTGTAFKQRGSDAPNTQPGTGPMITYMDKVVFYRNQYIDNEIAIDLVPARGNNLNAWVECVFKDNTTKAIQAAGTASSLFASSLFSNNGGDPSVFSSNQLAYYVNSKFVGGRAASVLGSGALCEGCTFSRGPSSTSNIMWTQYHNNTLDQRNVGLFNSLSTDMPLGPIAVSPAFYTMVMANNQFPIIDASWSVPLAMESYDTRHTLSTSDDIRTEQKNFLSGPTKPGSKLLRQR